MLSMCGTTSSARIASFRASPWACQRSPPTGSRGSSTWQGIFFDDDAAFAGQKRELTAADFVYSWKRVVDPRIRAPNANVLEGRLVGLDEALARAKSSGRFDYDTEIAGLRAIDRHTLRLQLVEPDYTLLTTFNQSALCAVAREVIEKYADSVGRVMDHPVGSGPYRLKEWQRNRRVLLEANPRFRDERFPPVPATADAATRNLAATMKGKRIPQIGIVDIAVVEETNPRLLMFSAGELDLIDIPGVLAPKIIDGANRLLPEYVSRGVDLQRATELTVTFTYFNMEDAVVGGYTPDRIALRRAICSAYNIDDEIRVLRNGQGIHATQPIPPDVVGHVSGFKGFAPYDPAVARALLDKFGYRDRDGDGYRASPDGTPLVLHMATLTGEAYRRYDELWQRGLQAVGIKVELQVQNFAEFIKAARAAQLQLAGLAWTSDTADEFRRLFYGPNAGAGNIGRFRNAKFDALYLQSRRTPEDRERAKLYAAMSELLAAYSPWCILAFRISNTVVASKILGYRKNVHYLIPPWQYLDIDARVQKTGAAMIARGHPLNYWREDCACATGTAATWTAPSFPALERWHPCKPAILWLRSASGKRRCDGCRVGPRDKGRPHRPCKQHVRHRRMVGRRVVGRLQARSLLPTRVQRAQLEHFSSGIPFG
jgi:oligopeptide transport system substrate-binding protein